MNIVRIGMLFVGDSDYLGLYRSQPCRKGPGIMFDQDTDKALKGTKDNPVQHDRSMLFAIRTNVAQVKSLRQNKITLYGCTLPGALQAVLKLKIDFRSVKCSVTFIDLILYFVVFQRFFQGIGCQLGVSRQKEPDLFFLGGRQYLVRMIHVVH